MMHCLKGLKTIARILRFSFSGHKITFKGTVINVIITLINWFYNFYLS